MWFGEAEKTGILYAQANRKSWKQLLPRLKTSYSTKVQNQGLQENRFVFSIQTTTHLEGLDGNGPK